MHNLPPSLSIALWLTGALWVAAFAIYQFGVDRHVLYATFMFGLAAALVEWNASRSQ